ncbi:MAG: hypothetical protein H7Z12_20365 [Rhodospirillaceae bacterium]|nr:hypothetical protein [Rhodospirillales bacterium]
MPDVTPREIRQDYTPTQAAHVREVVALFTDVHALEAAVQDLLTHGFDHGDLSVLASEKVVHERLGHRIEDITAAADDPSLPRRSWVEPEARMEGRGALASVLGYFGAVTALGLTFATGGAAAMAIGAAVLGAGAGAGVGVGLGKLFDQRLAREFESQLQHGGILLWARVNNDPTFEARAMEVLDRHGGHHAHVHEHRPT